MTTPFHEAAEIAAALNAGDQLFATCESPQAAPAITAVTTPDTSPLQFGSVGGHAVTCLRHTTREAIIRLAREELHHKGDSLKPSRGEDYEMYSQVQPLPS
jgi:hypothetical protein